jgi:hypothetical protein
MTEPKPKYIRKRCAHNRYTFQCKDCKGSCICTHGKQKSACKECGKDYFCEHGRTKYACVECDGKSICEHKKRRTRCIECGGGNICVHKKIRSRCAECGGTSLCKHNIRKEYCIECGGNSICEHKLRRSRCMDCNGSEICEHKNNKYTCVECHGNNICEHERLRYQCVDCKGGRICIHNRRKCMCIQCTPSCACQYCHFVYVGSSRYKPYCFPCYCVLHPNEEIPRRYRLKEHYVGDAIQKEFGESMTLVFNKTVEGGCSKRRPDIRMDFGSHCVMIEIDENRHLNYSCEEKRMVDLYEDVGFRKCVFLRFNPDGYRIGAKRYSTPFSFTVTGAMVVEETEMTRRMEELLQRVRYFKAHEPADMLTMEYLFYGDREEEEEEEGQG